MKKLLVFASLGLMALVWHHQSAPTHPTTLADMVKEGSYYHVDTEINDKSFLVKPERYRTEGLVLFEVEEGMYTEKLLWAMREKGLRPATLEELFAYTEKLRAVRSGVPGIFALGSGTKTSLGEYKIPAVFLSNHEKIMVLMPYGNWRPGIKCLAAPL